MRALAGAGGTIGVVTEQPDVPVGGDGVVPPPPVADGAAATPGAATAQPEPSPTAAGDEHAAAGTTEQPAAPPTAGDEHAAAGAIEQPEPPAADEQPATPDTKAAAPAAEDEAPATGEQPAARMDGKPAPPPAEDEAPTQEPPAAPAAQDGPPAADGSPTGAVENQAAPTEGQPPSGAGSRTPRAEVPATGDDAPAAGLGTPIRSAATTGGLNSGDIVSGVVSSVERRELELDLGSGRVGVIGSRHWSAGFDVDLTVEAKIGDTVEAAVLVREDHKQRIVLSRSWGRQQRAWELAENARKTGAIISGTVTDAVTAGLTVDIGVRAFVPASMSGDDDLESLVGTTVECKVTEVNQLKGRCILSRKAALRTRERQAARKRLADLTPGTMMRATVTRVEDFGALVVADGSLRGRIRRSELSWFRVRRPSDVVAVGDEVEARVVSTTPAKMSLDLSLRIGDDPLAGISPGERHQATVTSLAPFGAFVSVDGRIEGLVPTAELAENPIRHPREVVVPGDSVLAEVTKVDRQRRELEFSVNLAVLVRPNEVTGA